MLVHLSIKSFALVDEIELDFSSGLTVFVGETGAGKSIIIDAIAAALGDRLSSDIIRQGARKAVVEATFNPSGLLGVRNFIAEHDLEWEAEYLVVRRELSAGGVSRCFVNDNPTTASIVRELSENLIDFHGQHDTHGLLNAKRHRSILDSACDIGVLANTMSDQWTNVIGARIALNDLVKRSQKADEERARLQLVCNEIGQLNPQPNEDQHILQELRRAESSESIITHAGAAREALYSMEASAYDLIEQARVRLRSLVPYDASLEDAIKELDSAATACKEIASLVAHLADPADFSPKKLEELRVRQSGLNRLIRKYGSISEAIHAFQESKHDLHQLDDLEGALTTCQAHVVATEDVAKKTAVKISAIRKKAASSLAKAVSTSLQEMGIPSAQFVVECLPAELGPTGTDAIEFRFSANAGEDIQELSRIASGGELSRVMLALKKAVSSDGGIGTLVFDEIDTGVSGRIARAVGNVMKQLADRHQILCITHLPQIASLADNMIRVEKFENSDATTIKAAAVLGEDLVLEVARLLSSTSVTDAAIATAREMIATPISTKRS